MRFGTPHPLGKAHSYLGSLTKGVAGHRGKGWGRWSGARGAIKFRGKAERAGRPR